MGRAPIERERYGPHPSGSCGRIFCVTCAPGRPCISPGCPNRVAGRHDVCRQCSQAAAETIDEVEGEPADYIKNDILADHGYEEGNPR